MAAVDGVYLVLGRDPRKTLTSWVRGVLIRRRKKRFDKAKSQMHRRVVLSLFPQPRKHNMDTKKVALNIGFKTWHLFVQRQKEIENAEKTSFNYEQHNTNDDVIFSSVMERRSLLHSNAKKINMPQRRDFDNKNAMNRQDERYNQKLEIPLEFSAGPRRWLSRYLQRIIGAWRELTIEIRSKRWALLQCWHSLSRRWRFVAFGEWRRQAAAESARILLAKTITTIWARSRLAQIFTDWKLVQKCDDPKNLTEILRNESKLLRAHLRELTYLAEHHQSAAAELEDVTQRWQKRSLGESPATIAVGHKDLHDLSRRVDDARYLLHLFPPATFPDHSIPEEKKSIHQSEIDQEKDTSSIMEADDATEYIAPSRQQEIQVNFDEIFPQDISLSPKEIEDEIKGEKNSTRGYYHLYS
uniref:Uncharacterized protein n=1 Tax=Aureoumbra lagunensis TaxID=44058 RepID=A0A7S3K706_9STRA